MLRALPLLLPALIPSWDFFKTVAPSPRIEFWVMEEGPLWRELQPRPVHVPWWQMLHRMVWNPAWNEQLFMVSCAERLVCEPTNHSIHQIQSRIAAEVERSDGSCTVQFRLVFVSEAQGDLVKTVEYESAPFVVFKAKQ